MQWEREASHVARACPPELVGRKRNARSGRSLSSSSTSVAAVLAREWDVTV